MAALFAKQKLSHYCRLPKTHLLSGLSCTSPSYRYTLFVLSKNCNLGSEKCKGGEILNGVQTKMFWSQIFVNRVGGK